jgi:hypothetical protein
VNQRGVIVLEKILGLQSQAMSSLQFLLDNPDDAALSGHEDRMLRGLYDGQQIQKDALQALISNAT